MIPRLTRADALADSLPARRDYPEVVGEATPRCRAEHRRKHLSWYLFDRSSDMKAAERFLAFARTLVIVKRLVAS